MGKPFGWSLTPKRRVDSRGTEVRAAPLFGKTVTLLGVTPITTAATLSVSRRMGHGSVDLVLVFSLTNGGANGSARRTFPTPSSFPISLKHCRIFGGPQLQGGRVIGALLEPQRRPFYGCVNGVAGPPSVRR